MLFKFDHIACQTGRAPAHPRPQISSPLFALVFALTPAFLAPAPVFAQPTITAVFDADNLPYSSRRARPEGLHVEIARLLALQMGVQLDIEWVDTLAEGLLSPVVEGEADIAVGVPVEPTTVEDEENVGREVLFSNPFASVGYVLVTRANRDAVPDLRAIGKEPIGVERGSVASNRLWDAGFIVEGAPSQEQLLAGLVRGEVAYAVVWNNAGWLIRENETWRNTLSVQATAVNAPGTVWNLAVAVGKDSAQLLSRINQTIETLLEQNAFQPFFLKYHVPYAKPLEEIPE